jgi:glycosyltransferase involved in cell wall biosynthesis
MKILKVTGGFPPAEKEGGTAVVGHALAKWLTQAGHDVKAFTTNINGDGWLDKKNEWDNIDGVDVFYAEGTKKWARYRSPEMIAEIEKHIIDCDIVLMAAVWVWYGPKVAELCRTHNVPYVLYPHGVRSRDRMLLQSYYKKTAWWHIYDKNMFYNASGLVAITEFEKTEMRDIGVKCPIKVIANGVDPIPFIDCPRDLLKKEYEVPIDAEVILFLGRIETIKGVDLAIQSFQLVLEKRPDAFLILAGPDRSGLTYKLEQLAEKLGVRERIVFTGSVQGDLRSALYQSAHLLLLPSVTEVLAMSVLEALRSAIPVVVTDKDAFVDVAAYRAGFTCDRNKMAISSSMLMLLNDNELYKEMADNALQLAKDKYTWSSIASQTALFCEELIQAVQVK